MGQILNGIIKSEHNLTWILLWYTKVILFFFLLKPRLSYDAKYSVVQFMHLKVGSPWYGKYIEFLQTFTLVNGIFLFPSQ